LAVPKINLPSYTEKSTYDPAKQVEGYKRRIAATGLNPEKETDTRNLLERGLNLTPDQNALFDFFEILERPQQAMFNAIRAKQEGKDVGEALKNGITGKDVVRFKEILQAEGMEDSGDKIGADDIAGFLGDVFLDPMDVALIPLTGGASIAAKGAKGADTAIDVARAAKTTSRLASGSELVMKGLAKGVKGTAKLSDTGITKLLTKLDSIDEARDVAKGLHLAESYKSMKKVIQKTFDAASALPKGMMDKIRRVTGNTDYTIRALGAVKDDMYKSIDDFAATRKLAGETTEKAISRIDTDLLDFNEYLDYTPETTLRTIIEKQNMDKIPVDAKVADMIKDINTKFNMGFNPDKLLEKANIDGVEVYYMNKGFQDDFVEQYEKLLKNETTMDDFVKGKNAKDADIENINRYSGKSYSDSQYEVEKVRKSIPTQDAINAEVAAKAKLDATPENMAAQPYGGGTVINGKIIDTDEGFSVAWDKKQEKIVDSMQDVIDYAEKNNLKSYGYWTNDNGKIVIDVTSTYTKDPNIAFQLGYHGNQDAIYDWKLKDIPNTVDFGKTHNITPSSIADANKIGDVVKGISHKDIVAPRFYSQADKARFDKLATDADFVKLSDKARQAKDDMLSLIDLGSSDVDEMGQIIPGTSTTRFDSSTEFGVYRHAASEQYKGLTKKIRDSGSEQVGLSSFKGNVNVMSGREYKMSSLEANRISREHQARLVTNGTAAQREFWGNQGTVKLFEDSLKSSMDDFIDQAPQFAKNANMIDTVLVHGWMEDPEIIKGIGRTEKVPVGYSRVPKSSLVNKLNALSKYVSPASEDAFKATVKNLPNMDDLLIDSNVFDLVGRLDSTKSTNLIVDVLDKANNFFKATKLMSPGFQMRNILGNSTNMYLSGIPVDEVFKGFGKADVIMKTGEDLIKRVTLDPLSYAKMTDLEKETYRVYSKFIRNNFHEVAEEMWEMPAKYGKGDKNIITDIQRFNNKINSESDKRFRMAAMMYAEKNPEIYKKLGLNSDVSFVRHTLFDPKDLSAAEKNIGKRLIPFYTFTKKNLAFQMKNLIDNPVKYKNVKKAIQDIWDAKGIDSDNLESYKRENFWLPVMTKKNGEYVALKSNLPIGDLGEFLQNPLAKVTSAITPLARVPFELATNTQTYTGLPIQEFKGQKGYNMPALSRKQEYLLSQTGLDVPIMGVSDVMKAGAGLAKGELSGGQALQTAFGRSLVSSGSTAKAATTRAYTELDQMQQLMKYYKQQGVNILTIAEAENQNLNLNAVTAAIARLRQ